MYWVTIGGRCWHSSLHSMPKMQVGVCNRSFSRDHCPIRTVTSQPNGSQRKPFVQDRIHSLTAHNAYDTEEYEATDNVSTTFFTLRTAPAPDCFTASAGRMNKDVYVGASEFAISGVLGDWNVTGRLHEIDVPVLLTHGKFDTMIPSIVKTMQGQLKLSERVLLPHSGYYLFSARERFWLGDLFSPRLRAYLHTCVAMKIYSSVALSQPWTLSHIMVISQ
mmetsp:Transcript_41007/g.67299  ORF Transcript_41007/g.67299 Transcript_41007/m.67299 type:complete len:220 (-) Transcript_41007:54-713(-)